MNKYSRRIKILYLLVLALGLCCAGCVSDKKREFPETGKDGSTINYSDSNLAKDDEMNSKYMQGEIADEQFVALVNSQEEAEKVAEDYGVELVSFSYGVATYRTDEDISTVLKRGKGPVKLNINYIRELQ